MSSSILLVTSSPQISNQIQVILEFLDYAVTQCSFNSLDTQDALQKYSAIFVENSSTTESAISSLRKRGLEQPIVLIVDQTTEQRIDNSALSNITNAIINWPLSQKQLSHTLQTLRLNESHSKQPRRSVELFRSLWYPVLLQKVKMQDWSLNR